MALIQALDLMDQKTPRLDITLKALETGAICRGPLQTVPFEFVDTYRSKRKIHLKA